jgi:hypothetical protein
VPTKAAVEIKIASHSLLLSPPKESFAALGTMSIIMMTKSAIITGTARTADFTPSPVSLSNVPYPRRTNQRSTSRGVALTVWVTGQN